MRQPETSQIENKSDIFDTEDTTEAADGSTSLLGRERQFTKQVDPGCSNSTMIQHNRKLSNPRSRSSSSAYFSNHYSIFFKGGALATLMIFIYLNRQILHSIDNDTGIVQKETVSTSSAPMIQQLDAIPTDLLTTKSTIQEWERQAGSPTIGLYRYSSIAAIQFPTEDLEKTISAPNQLEKGSVNEDTNLSNNNDIVVLTRKGHKFNPEDRKRTPNQDRVLVLSKPNNKNNEAKNEWWMGLFDGHGFYGHSVSQYISMEFARRINKEWEGDNFSLSPSPESSTEVKEKLKTFFHEINHSFPSIMRVSGSTGISVLKRGNSLYISNVGDSVGFVASYDKSQKSIEIVYSTIPHKPDSPTERKRIEEKGGTVYVPTIPGAPARLIVVTNDGMQHGLAPSRGFGDLDGEKFGFIVEPDTDVLDLSQFDKNKEYFAVAATDGLIDNAQLSKEEVALAMAKAMSDEENQSHLRRRFVSARGTEAARELIMKASKLWGEAYRDDISIVAHRIRL